MFHPLIHSFSGADRHHHCLCGRSASSARICFHVVIAVHTLVHSIHSANSCVSSLCWRPSWRTSGRTASFTRAECLIPVATLILPPLHRTDPLHPRGSSGASTHAIGNQQCLTLATGLGHTSAFTRADTSGPSCMHVPRDRCWPCPRFPCGTRSLLLSPHSLLVGHPWALAHRCTTRCCSLWARAGAESFIRASGEGGGGGGRSVIFCALSSLTPLPWKTTSSPKKQLLSISKMLLGFSSHTAVRHLTFCHGKLTKRGFFGSKDSRFTSFYWVPRRHLVTHAVNVAFR